MGLTATTFILLLIIPGLQAQAGWSVTFTYRHICAVRGSTVNISCTYTYPPDLRVNSTFWFREDKRANDLKSEPEYSGRVESVCENNNTCTLMIRDLTESDSGVYLFRIITNNEKGRWTGQPGVSLTVTELQIHVRRETVDQSRNQTELTCVSQCGDSLQSSYIWYRNDETLGGQTQRELVLQSTDATGRYSCALSGHQRFRSPPVYAPEGPSVSVSPSAEVEEGSSVTLSCSSDANPAANYSWFKDNQSLRGGQHLQIIVQPGDRGFYSCNAANEFGSVNSSARFLDVQYPPKSCSVSASPSAEVEEGSSVTLSCSSDANPADYSWFKDGEKTPKSSEQNFTITNVRAEDAGNYSCHVWNARGRLTSSLRLAVSGPVSSVAIGTMAAAAAAAAGLLLCSAWFLTRRKRSMTPPTGGPGSRSDADPAETPGEPEEVCYASVTFHRDQESPYSHARLPRTSRPTGQQEEQQKEEEEEQDVNYVAVRFRSAEASAQGSGDQTHSSLYATVSYDRPARGPRSLVGGV